VTGSGRLNRESSTRHKEIRRLPRPIRLFVSCSPGLTPEREIVGQAVAELPVEVGWEIKHTAGPGEDDRPAVTFVDRCDFYLLLLGGDFAAPMGVELRRAQLGSKPLLAYRKEVPQSPAAQQVRRRSDLAWTTFQTPLQLKRTVSQALAEAILDRGEQFGLHVREIEALLKITRSKGQEGRSEEADRRRGAGRGGVILGRPTES
jgi:hypothetical protein